MIAEQGKYIDAKTIEELEKEKEKYRQLEYQVEGLIGVYLADLYNDPEIDIKQFDKQLQALLSDFETDSTSIGLTERQKAMDNLDERYRNQHPYSNKKQLPLSDILLSNLDSTINKTQIKEIPKRAKKVLRNYQKGFTIGVNGYVNDDVLISEVLDTEKRAKIAVDKAFKDMQDKFIKDDNVSYFVDKAGRRMRYEDWYERQFRTTFVQQMDQDLFNQMTEFEIDLVRTSYHSDSSPLCFPYQASIYSLSGKSTKYPAYEPILWANGGGYRHPNCRHFNTAYFEGDSIPTDELYPNMNDAKETQEEYEARLMRKRQERARKKGGAKTNRAKAIEKPTPQKKKKAKEKKKVIDYKKKDIDISKDFTEESKKHIENAKKISENINIDDIDDIEAFNRAINNLDSRAYDIKYNRDDKGAHYNDWKHKVALRGTSDTNTYLHEMGHAFDHARDSMLKRRLKGPQKVDSILKSKGTYKQNLEKYKDIRKKYNAHANFKDRTFQSIDDIFDAFYMGKPFNAGDVLAGHGTKYYGQGLGKLDKEIKDIFKSDTAFKEMIANYTSLQMGKSRLTNSQIDDIIKDITSEDVLKDLQKAYKEITK